MFSFLWLSYHYSQSSRKRSFIEGKERLRLGVVEGHNKGIHQARALSFQLLLKSLLDKKKKVLCTNIPWTKQTVRQKLIGTKVRAETLHLWRILCVTLWNQENLDSKDIWIFASIFRQPNEIGVMAMGEFDWCKHIVGHNTDTCLLNFEKKLNRGIMFKTECKNRASRES